MSIITEEMAVEYHKCSLYKEYIEQLRISEKNEGDEFMQSLRCSNIYVPDTEEVTEKYRKQAEEQGIEKHGSRSIFWLSKKTKAISHNRGGKNGRKDHF